MIDLLDAHLALRGRAESLVVATTGVMSLSRTSTGYARSAPVLPDTATFLTDRFAVGMEITPLGFPTNPVEVVTYVDALTLRTTSHATAAATGGRSLTAGLPAARSYENVSPEGDFEPTVGFPWIEENFVPATNRVLTFPRSIGHLEETGLYVIKWYGLSGKGVAAIRRSVGELKALYAPGTTFAVGSDSVEVRGDPAPWDGQITPVDGGWAVCTLTIPWLARSRNAIAA